MTLLLAIGAWYLSTGNTPQVVTAGAPPRAIATTPMHGQVISAGPFVLSVTFDRPMMDRSYSFVQKAAETFPKCQSDPVLSADARTYSWSCIAEPGRQYEIWFNSPPYLNFRSIEGVPAQPHQLLFRTR